MGIRSALFAYLSGHAALTTLLGATADIPKVFPHVAIAGTGFPYVTFRRNDEPGDRTLRDGSIRTATIIVTAWSASTSECEAVVETIRPALEAWRGDQPDHGVSVRLANPIGEEDDDVSPDDATDVRWYATIITLRITYTALS